MESGPWRTAYKCMFMLLDPVQLTAKIKFRRRNTRGRGPDCQQIVRGLSAATCAQSLTHPLIYTHVGQILNLPSPQNGRAAAEPAAPAMPGATARPSRCHARLPGAWHPGWLAAVGATASPRGCPALTMGQLTTPAVPNNHWGGKSESISKPSSSKAAQVESLYM